MDTMESTNLIFDVNNSIKSLIATKENLESIMIMDAISSMGSMFVFGSWESFDVDSSYYDKFAQHCTTLHLVYLHNLSFAGLNLDSIDYL